jgi:hypothetical protein
MFITNWTSNQVVYVRILLYHNKIVTKMSLIRCYKNVSCYAFDENPFHRMFLRVNRCGLSHWLCMLGCVNGICILSEAKCLGHNIIFFDVVNLVQCKSKLDITNNINLLLVSNLSTFGFFIHFKKIKML